MKNILTSILVLAILASLTACGGKVGTPVETTATTTTATTTTVGEGVLDIPDETTTAAVGEEPTLPEFDINAEECLMYRLLDMTVEEIEAEFGELTMYGIIAGGTPCYQLEESGVQLLFDTYPDVMTAPLPRDAIPEWTQTNGYESVLYPDIYVGMDSKEYNEKIGIDDVSYSLADFFPGFSSSCVYDGYRITVLWEIPQELSDKAEAAICWGEEGEGETAKSELIVDMKSGEVNVKVKRITISKGD